MRHHKLRLQRLESGTRALSQEIASKLVPSLCNELFCYRAISMWLNNTKHPISSSKNGKTLFDSKGESFMGRHVLAAEVVKQWE